MSLFLLVVSQILPEIQEAPTLSGWEELTFEDVFIIFSFPCDLSLFLTLE